MAMSPADFTPREYTTPDGHLRVYQAGALWYADVRSPDGAWCPVVEHARHHLAAMVRCLEALDLLDPEPEDPPEGPDDLTW
jgi:hypothetical protein